MDIAAKRFVRRCCCAVTAAANLLVTGTPGAAADPTITNAFITIGPEDQRQLITDWGYDIKQGGKAAGLTPSLAEVLFVDDKMSVLRIPIHGDAGKPAHPASGVVIASYYADMRNAMTNARAANSNVLLFASKKLDGQESFPSWVKDANGIIPSQYAALLADYLQFLETNGFVVDVLGVDNEENYNEGNITPSRYKDIIDQLRALSFSRGFTMPSRLIAPEDYGPEDAWMNTLISNGWGDRCDIVGTHYYPAHRPIAKLRNLSANGAPRPVWNSEVHWDNKIGDDIDNAEASLAALFDNTDVGLSGFVWWAYNRSATTVGGIEHGFTTTTAQSRPVTTLDGSNGSPTLGKLMARAFRAGTNVSVWIVNNTPTNIAHCAINITSGAISGPAAFRQWNLNYSISGGVDVSAPTTARIDLPPRTVTVVSFPYTPAGPIAHYPFEGNALDATGMNNHGALTGGAAFIPGRMGGQAVQFEGSTGYALIPRSIGSATNFSIAFWVRTTAAGGTGNQWWNGSGLVDGEVAGTTNDFGVTLLAGRIAFGVGAPDTTLKSALQVDDGAWHHVAITRNGFDGEMRIYLDGVLNTNRLGPKGVRTASANLRIGSLQTGAATKFFDGSIDDVRLYNGLLESDEIRRLAAVAAPNAQPVLDPIENRTLLAGQTLVLTNTASDPDAPPQLLTWRIDRGPAGATIDPNIGVIEWRPLIAQSPSTNLFEIVIADNGVPSLSATQQFSAAVLEPARPIMSRLVSGPETVQLSVAGDAGPDYTLLASSNLVAWLPLWTTTSAVPPFTVSLPMTNQMPRQYFRLLLGP